MPYITKEARLEIAEGRLSQTPGELNYVISTELWKWCKDRSYVTDLEAIMLAYLRSKPTSYSTFNEIMGVLEYIYREFRRRAPTKPYTFCAAERIRHLQDILCARYSDPYEDGKIKINGDVFLED